MNTKITNLKNSLLHQNKIKYWAKIISITGFAQFGVQIAGLVSGIIIIRLLPIKEYALYTIANTMLGTLTILTDNGITNGVMVEGGKVWKDRQKLGLVLSTGFNLRKLFAIGSLLISTPILVLLLYKQGANWKEISLIVLCLAPAFWASVSDSLLEIIPKIHQDIPALQKNSFFVSIGRLALTSSTMLIFPWTSIALLSNGIPRIYGNFKLRKISSKYADFSNKSDITIRKNILRIVAKVMPINIYYSVSGQIVIWILSIFGNSDSIAQIGALSRLALILTFFTKMVQTLIIPRFARLDKNDKKIIPFFFKSQFLLIGIAIFIVGVIMLFPKQILWILGSSYQDLSFELILLMIGASIGFVSSTTGNLISSRGHILHPLIVIGINVFCLVASIFLFDLTTIKGALNYKILNVSITLLILTIYSFNSLKKNYYWNPKRNK